MRSTSKRHTRQDVRSGSPKLPSSLKFLEYGDYEAVVQHKRGSRSSWAVEVKPGELKKLFADRVRARSAEQTESEFRAEIEGLQRTLRQRDKELQEVNARADLLQKNLDTLLANESEDRRPVPRSFKKDFFHHAAEAGLNLRQRALPGGLPGLPKRGSR